MTNTQAIRRCLMVVVGIALCTAPAAAQNKVRIIQTNSAGDNVHIIDPATNKVVAVINGIEVGHGAAVAVRFEPRRRRRPCAARGHR